MMSEMRKMHTSEIFEALLCDPNGKVVIHGSDKDRQLLEEAIKEVKVLENKAGSIKVGVEDIEKIADDIFRDYYVPLYSKDKPLCEMTSYETGVYRTTQMVVSMTIQAILNNLKEKE